METLYIRPTRFFLLNRTIKTRVGSSYSTSLDFKNLVFKSDIVQGSCIGSLLFIIYINDVADLFDGNVNLVYTPTMLSCIQSSTRKMIAIFYNRQMTKMVTPNILYKMHD